MDISLFAQLTRKIIADSGGLEEFVPVACFPVRREIRVLEGLPSDVDVEQATLEWARDGCDDPEEECLVAFRHSPSEFKVVRFVGKSEKHQVYAAYAV